ncbi:MAG: 4Fe-4S dicluster domain-containing protein [Acidobacteriota bacterium]
MDRLTLRKSDVPAFLESLLTDYRVVAPRRVAASDFVFDDYRPGEAVPFDFVNTLVPPKNLFLKPRETLFRIRGATQPVILPGASSKPLALFGLRPCDASGLVFLERFFSERGFEDDTVTAGIRRSLRMVLCCHTPGANCFCVCCDGGPALTSGFDLLLTDLGQSLLVEVGSEAGHAAVQRRPELFAKATEADYSEKVRQMAAVDQNFDRRSYVANAMKRISLARITQEFWQNAGADCRGCGGCCFVCPTCSCFSVTDKPDGDDHCRRERWRDACLYEGFTREASGHNPRASKADRLKRRFFHKLSYQYVELMGRHGCVGCGRCVTTCMGKLGIPDFLARVHDECK